MVRQLTARMPPRPNIGSSRKRCMVSAKAPVTGTTRSRRFSKASTPNPTPRIHACSQEASATQTIPLPTSLLPPLPLDSMSMTLFISLKTLKLNDGLNSSSPVLSLLTFGGPLIGSWALISNGHVTTTKHQPTSAKPASRLTSLKTTTSTHAISLQMLLPIARGSPSARALNPTKPMTAQRSSNARRDTKVWLVRSVGWLKAQGPTSPHPTPSCRPTITNHPKATGTLHSTSSTTFTQRSTMDLPSRPRHNFLSTRSCRSLHHLTPKHTPTPSRRRLLSIIVSPPIAMPAGDPSLAMQSAKASNSHSSNFGV